MKFAMDNVFFLMVTVVTDYLSLSVSSSAVIYYAPVSLRLFISVGVAFLFHSPGFQRCSSCTPVRHLPCQSCLVPSVPLANQLLFCSLASSSNSPHLCFSTLSLHPHSISLAYISRLGQVIHFVQLIWWHHWPFAYSIGKLPWNLENNRSNKCSTTIMSKCVQYDQIPAK